MYKLVLLGIVYEGISTIIILAFKCLALAVTTLFCGQKKIMIVSVLETPFQLPTYYLQKIFLKAKLKREVRL